MDVSILNQQFEYRDGELYWAVNRSGVKKGRIASRTNPTSGYRDTRLFGKIYQTHRLIYLMHHGVLPEFVDHIDNNCLNNRIENLRPTTKSQNAFNRRMRSNNTSGVKGVSWNKRNRKWMVRVCVEGKEHYFGLHDDLQVATDIANKARLELHGEFARMF